MIMLFTSVSVSAGGIAFCTHYSTVSRKMQQRGARKTPCAAVANFLCGNGAITAEILAFSTEMCYNKM
jgi:hypothetical protein